MTSLAGWRLVFLAAVGLASLVLLGYTEFRRILHAAVDDRYGESARFWQRAAVLPDSGKRLGYQVHYVIAFFFFCGARDLMRLGSLLAFDLFVVFAFLSPFWRFAFFGDWNPILAAAVSAAGASVFMAWKLRQGLELCRVHGWAEDGHCQRCGEPWAQIDEPAPLKKGGKTANRLAAGKPSWRERLSWSGLWARRLESLTERLEKEGSGR